MKIIYHGHACFEIIGEEDPKSIIFDPYGEGTGNLKLNVKADLALCTHDHFDHNNCRVGKQHLVLFSGEKTIGSAKIRGVPLAHDPEGGKLRGKITAFVVNYGGRVIVHLGDLGHIPNDKQISDLLSYGRPDVLFIPVGGIYTIGPNEAIEVIKLLNPRIAIPMHYNHPKLNPQIFSKLHKLEDFLKLWVGEIEKVGKSEWELPSELPEKTKIVVLEFP